MPDDHPLTYRPPAPASSPASAVAAGPDARDISVSERAAARITASVPAETRRAYAGDWRRFRTWCADAGRTALPATTETLATYASALADAGKAPATIVRALAAVRTVHRLNSAPVPDTAAVRAVIKAYRTERADAGLTNRRPAAALPVRALRSLVATLDQPDGPADGQDGNPALRLRDQVTLVLGWAMMARRGELAGLMIGDLVEVADGLDVAVRASKTDRNADGRQVAVPYGSDPTTCPVRLVRRWLALLADHGITTGPLLRRIDRHGNIAGAPGTRCAGRGRADGGMSGEAVGIILTRAATAAGLELPHLRAHSLRAGGATGAYVAGADLLSIGRHGGWSDGSTVLYGYIRDVDRWRKNPMHGTGL